MRKLITFFRTRRYVRNVVLAILLSLTFAPSATAAYVLVKAQLAQVLIKKSWNDHGSAPWPWADTRPVARLQINRLHLDAFVLEGASGESLAFGPGLSAGSTQFGDPGVALVAAHRDTHFKNLGEIKIGDEIRVQSLDKSWYHYRVESTTIADSRFDKVAIDTDDARLVLVTCYPFDAIRSGGPHRFVVAAPLL